LIDDPCGDDVLIKKKIVLRVQSVKKASDKPKNNAIKSGKRIMNIQMNSTMDFSSSICPSITVRTIKKTSKIKAAGRKVL